MMGGGAGSIAAMIQSVKSNMAMVRGRGAFKSRQAMYSKYKTGLNKIHNPSPEELRAQLKRAKVLIEDRRKRLNAILSAGFILAFAIMAFLVWYLLF